MSDIQVMGIVNITPDSFSDGGQFLDVDKALRHSESLIQAGATILDIGAQSTRPGSTWISPNEEIERLSPILERYRSYFSIPLSLDTVNASTALFGIQHGVTMINDISAGTHDPQMMSVAAQHQIPMILMHMQGIPKTMQDNPTYQDVVHEVYTFLENQVQKAKKMGVPSVVVDPGIGFGKTAAHTITLLNQLHVFTPLAPVLVGPSRKSFLATLTGQSDPYRLEGTIASCIWSLYQGATWFRVHDVEAVARALHVACALRKG